MLTYTHYNSGLINHVTVTDPAGGIKLSDLDAVVEREFSGLPHEEVNLQIQRGQIPGEQERYYYHLWVAVSSPGG